MDSFEQLIAEILWNEGYWVKTEVKVALTKEEKVLIGRPSAPRWEIDVIGYKGKSNKIKVVECKSYIDSSGVAASAFNGKNQTFATRFKLFNEPITRNVVFNRLKLQLAASGFCQDGPEIDLCLACGRISSDRDRAWLHAHFKEHNWELWDDEWIRQKLRIIAEGGYENNVSSVVSKLLLRARKPAAAPPPIE